MGHSGMGLGGVILIVLLVLLLLREAVSFLIIEITGFISTELSKSEPCADLSSPPISAFRSCISVKQAYIRGERLYGAPPGCDPPSSNPDSLDSAKKK